MINTACFDLSYTFIKTLGLTQKDNKKLINNCFFEVEWFCNGRPLTIGSRFKTYNDFGFIALDIVGVNMQDAGAYTCRASNQMGQAETAATVKVIFAANYFWNQTLNSKSELACFKTIQLQK